MSYIRLITSPTVLICVFLGGDGTLILDLRCLILSWYSEIYMYRLLAVITADTSILYDEINRDRNVDEIRYSPQFEVLEGRSKVVNVTC